MLPLSSFGAEQRDSVYTIQLGSHNTIERAHKQYDAVVNTLNMQELDYLRIEKIGKFHAVRLGKFNSHTEALNFLESVTSRLSSSIIIDAYFIEERIERMYETSDADDEVTPQKSPVPEDVKAENKVETQETPAPEDVTADDEARTEETPAPEEATKEEPGETEPPAVILSEQKADVLKEDVPVEEQIEHIAILVHRKDYDNALEIIKSEIAEKPENPELNAWYGAVLIKTEKPKEALPYMEKAVELAPSVADYHNGVGYALLHLDRTDEAVEAFDKALKLEPEHVDALAGLGIIYAKSGDKKKAIDIYNRLKSLDQDSANKLMKLIEGPQH
jgi:Flp pilus assembly protein TadD